MLISHHKQQLTRVRRARARAACGARVRRAARARGVRVRVRRARGSVPVNARACVELVSQMPRMSFMMVSAPRRTL
jgi:hypothetical protein